MSESKVSPPDPDELARRAQTAIAGRRPGARVRDVRPLLGGTSSLTYEAWIGGEGGDSSVDAEHVVLKVAPPGLEPVRNRDVLRQARVFEALAGVPDVKVPAVLGEDVGAPPEVPPLFVMSFAPGESYEPVLNPPNPSVTPAEIEARYLAAARMMAALHLADASGVAGEKETDLGREVGRWTKAFSTVDDELRGGERADRVNERLVKALPDALPSAILHGDYRLGNMQCQGGEITALIDWEIWSLGDPRLDVAWFLLNSDPRHPSRQSEPDIAIPPSDRLIAAYQDASGHKLEGLDWFAALVRYKQAAASALIVKNSRRMAKEGVDTERTLTNIPRLLDWALEYLD